MKRTLTLLTALLVAACTGIPDGIEPVQDFKLERYLGTWYEVARLDHRFERGLSNVSANYTLGDDGRVIVSNRGYREDEGEWDEALGKAYFIDDTSVGRLKVSFFGPFYGAYNVFILDKEGYDYAVVAGPDRSYLWLLSRSPSLPDGLRDELVAKIAAAGYNTEDLIFVKHDRNDPARVTDDQDRPAG